MSVEPGEGAWLECPKQAAIASCGVGESGGQEKPSLLLSLKLLVPLTPGGTMSLPTTNLCPGCAFCQDAVLLGAA